jgi:periplasmic protein TonB
MKHFLYISLSLLALQACSSGPTAPDIPKISDTAEKPSAPQEDSLSPKDPKTMEAPVEKDNNGAPKKSKAAPVQFVVPKIDPNTLAEESPPVYNREKTGTEGYNMEGTNEPWPEGEGVFGNYESDPVNPDIQAKFPGGDVAFMEFIKSSFIYPSRCLEEGIDGYVMLRFIVDTKGVVSNITAVETTKSCPEFTTEAIRVLKKSPRWIPGMVSGKFVKSYRIIPIKLNVK